ncbi:MAG TPA: MotA/TolQ/ExbB proton channel family protein [Opitutaceae bacterium]|nr:MotA/TolQ/ExbB proton channel family protein [Opitutaceae bacterium]
MKRVLSSVCTLGCLLAVARAAPSFDEAMTKAAGDYRERVAQAAQELNQTRARIAAEKAPLLEQLRATEDRIIALESETSRLETHDEDTAAERRKLLQELETTRKTTAYASTLAHDGLKAVDDGLAPGEEQIDGERIADLLKRLDDPGAGPSGQAALDIADFLLARTQRTLGGYRAQGQAMIAETSQMLPGTFAFTGPETFFLPAAGGPAGTVRRREGAKYPASYALAGWKADDAAAFFAGRPGTIVADASGGKALRLKETSGTLWQHVQKGGVMAYVILGVGLLALLMFLDKVRDLTRMEVEPPEAVAAFLDLVARGATAEAAEKVRTLGNSVRELFTAGLRFADQPKAILEERLQAVVLAQRLHYERRLPLLAVIATAAPLMGLLGTVIGMVKTFALITVFGTGNAARLASGISEVLVATQLGLVVAIPTLIAHGFLAHRIHKNLALLERYALEFCTAVETAAAGTKPREPVPA